MNGHYATDDAQWKLVNSYFVQNDAVCSCSGCQWAYRNEHPDIIDIDDVDWEINFEWDILYATQRMTNHCVKCTCRSCVCQARRNLRLYSAKLIQPEYNDNPDCDNCKLIAECELHRLAIMDFDGDEWN